MKNILLSLLATALTSGIITALGGGPFEKYLRYLCALLLTLVLLTPLRSLLTTGFSPPQWLPQEEIQSSKVPDSFLRQFEEEVEKAATSLITSELSLSASAFKVEATAADNNGTPYLSKVELTLYTLMAAAKTEALRDCLSKACGCTVTVCEEINN